MKYLFILILIIGIMVSVKEIQLNRTILLKSNISISQCFLKSPNIPYYPDMYTLGSLGHETLINCLIKYESNGNENAYNPCDTDGREKIGILQFDSRTFKHYCVDRYELPNDIWNGDIQKTCCDNMISENWGNIYHWGTINLCIK